MLIVMNQSVSGSHPSEWSTTFEDNHKIIFASEVKDIAISFLFLVEKERQGDHGACAMSSRLSLASEQLPDANDTQWLISIEQVND